MIKKEIKRFGDAFDGLALFFKAEPHAKFHLLAIVIVVCSGVYFKISVAEWIVILIAFALVICTELLNTAVEKLCDFVHIEQHPNIKIIKHLTAASVLFASIISAIIAFVIFIPKI